MPSKKDIDELAVDASDKVEEARVMAAKAKDGLSQVILKNLEDEDDLAELDPQDIRALADDYADAVQALKSHEWWMRRLRRLQMS